MLSAPAAIIFAMSASSSTVHVMKVSARNWPWRTRSGVAHGGGHLLLDAGLFDLDLQQHMALRQRQDLRERRDLRAGEARDELTGARVELADGVQRHLVHVAGAVGRAVDGLVVQEDR